MQAVLDAAFAGGAHLAYTDGAFRRFTGTHWAPLSDAELGGVVLHRLSLEASTNRGGQRSRTIIREVIELLKMHRATGADRSRLDEPRPVINVANGELWISADGSVELRPHHPASGLRYCLGVIYDPNAICPRYDRALTEIFSASATPAALVAFWHELTGYVLQPSRPDARIIVGWGAGNDGKTALTRLLTSLLGDDRVAAMPVSKLASNHFMLGHLADKSLFLDDDVASGTVLPDGVLKTISEAKTVTGEPKHRDAFEFQVRALPLMLCNDVPHLRDTSYGFRRRLMVIPFERRFEEAEADRTLFPHIREKELSGVLNRALAGLCRVAQRGWRFDPPASVVEATGAWWSLATGMPSAEPVSMRGPLETSMVPRAIQSPISPMDTKRQVARKVQPDTADPGLDLNLSISLPATRKACTVHVQVNPASVEVRVITAPVEQAVRLRPLGDGC